MPFLPNQSFPLPTPPPPPIVLCDLPCRKCSYNLRTLPTTAVCPECATPIADSMRSDLLHDGDPRWLRTVCDGVFCLLVTYVLYLCWITTDGLMHVPLKERRWVFLLGGRSLQMVGVWMATTRDARLAAEKRGEWLTIACRVMAIFHFAGGVFWLGILDALPLISADFRAFQYVDDLSGIAVVSLMLFFLSWLVSRVPDQSLSRYVRWTAVALTIGACAEEALLALPGIGRFVFSIPPFLGIAHLIGAVALVLAVSSCNAAIRRESD